MRMTPVEALAFLYSTSVKLAHPDSTESCVLPSIAELKEARDVLRQVVAPNTQNNPCGTCRGNGTVRRKFGTVPCGTCKGTGDQP